MQKAFKIVVIVTFIVFGIIFVSRYSYAQKFQISLDGYNGSVMGDFKENDLNNSSAGFSSLGYGSALEFRYYFEKGWGLSGRWSYMGYTRDVDAYKDALENKLNINDDNNAMIVPYDFSSIGFHAGFSYPFILSEKFQFEPYMYIGFKALVSPAEKVVYYQNSETKTYSKSHGFYAGFSYIPGMHIQWNITKYFGLKFFFEYEGAAFSTYEEDAVNYTATAFAKETIERQYNPQTLNYGLGLVFNFGKGVKDDK